METNKTETETKVFEDFQKNIKTLMDIGNYTFADIMREKIELNLLKEDQGI